MYLQRAILIGATQILSVLFLFFITSKKRVPNDITLPDNEFTLALLLLSMVSYGAVFLNCVLVS